MTIGSNPSPAWYTDPFLGPPRLRWWAGARWTAWIVTSAVTPPSLAWRPDLADLPSPICWGTTVLRVAAAPPLQITALDPGVPSERPGAALAVVPRDEATTGRRRPRRVVMVAAAIVLVVGLAAAASAMLLTHQHLGLGPVVGHTASGAGWR